MTTGVGSVGPTHSARQRIQGIGPDDWTDEIESLQQILSRHPIASWRAKGGRASAGAVFSVLVRHPSLYRAWATFTTELRLVQKLPTRDRELLVLRTGWRCQAPYEWGQHVRMALQTGFTHEEIERVIIGSEAADWDEFERAVLRSADELHDTGTICDATWSVLTSRYSEDQLIELPMVVGWYHLIAYVHNALQIPTEPDVGGLEAR